MTQPVANLSQTSRMFYGQYLQRLSPDARQAIQKVAVAIGYVFTQDNQVNGSALAVDRNLILVPKHCFPFDYGRIFFECLPGFIIAQTYLDGENDPPSAYRSDFKILKIEGANLSPAPLSVDSPIGKGVQLSYQIDGNFSALPYETVEADGGYATRSDFANVITANGDSGGARFSWLSKGVSGIHQGQSEALTINQIYHVVEAIFNGGRTTGLRQRAREVLRALDVTIIDKTMLHMHHSTVYLHPGQVIPERHGLFQSKIESIEEIAITPKTATIPTATVNLIFEYLKLIIASKDKKIDFFSKIPGSTGNIYRIPDKKNEVARIDRQVPTPSQSNIQIQVDGYTVTTVLVDDNLYRWAVGDAAKIAAVTNYIVRLLWVGLKKAEYERKAIVRAISLINV